MLLRDIVVAFLLDLLDFDAECLQEIFDILYY